LEWTVKVYSIFFISGGAHPLKSSRKWGWTPSAEGEKAPGKKIQKFQKKRFDKW
jgi:hypothetical protein